MKKEKKKILYFVRHRQLTAIHIYIHTSGCGDSMTNSAQRAKSMKMVNYMKQKSAISSTLPLLQEPVKIKYIA